MDKETVRAYSLMAEEYDDETAGFWSKFPKSIVKNFASRAGTGLVLDVGSGPGRDGLILKSYGLEIICLDASLPMVQITHQKSLPSVQADFMNIPFKNEVFNGIWAYTSLIHIPKLELPAALAQVNRVLQKGGTFGLGVIEGSGEGVAYSLAISLPRHFAFYQDAEIRQYLNSSGFEVFYQDTFQPRSRNYLNYLATKVHP